MQLAPGVQGKFLSKLIQGWSQLTWRAWGRNWGYWILVPWVSTIEYRCLLCAPSSCVATPPASDSKSGGREVHLVIDWGVCVSVCVCTLAVWSSEHEASRVLDGSHFIAFTPFYNWTTTMIATTSLPVLNKAWVRALLALPSPYWAK